MRRVNDDALHFHHVIGTPDQGINPRPGPAAAAFTGEEARQVVGAVIDQRCAFLLQRGDHQFADLTIFQTLTGMWIDDFAMNVVVEIVHPALAIAADADARTVDFGEAVDVVQFDTELMGNAPTHLFSPAFRADQRFFKVDFLSDAAPGDFLGQQQRIGRRRAQHRAFHILHEFQLPVGITRPHRNAQRAQTFAAILKTDACGP